MFGFDKINIKDKLLMEHFDDYYCFSKDQKIAILLSLFEIANSDNQYHRTETEYFKKISKYMGLTLPERKLKRLLRKEKEMRYKHLRDLADHQKDWYVNTVLGMVYSDGIVEEHEFAHIEAFLIKLGFSKEIIDRNSANLGSRYLHNVGNL